MPALLAAYRPFVDPLNVDGWWPLLLLPLLFAVALVYKTLKLPTLERLVPEALKLAGEVLAVMVVLALLLRWLA